MRNILLAISGPSGVGKGTLVKMLLAADKDLALSVSCTTRAPREGERDGIEYFFLTREEFEKRIAEDDFLEYDEHLSGLYGTPKSFVQEMLREKSVVLEIDVMGVTQVKQLMPETVTVFIAPPSWEELLGRLQGRQTETDEQVANRMKRAEEEMAFAPRYDYTVVNDRLDEALQALRTIIAQEKNKE